MQKAQLRPASETPGQIEIRPAMEDKTMHYTLEQYGVKNRAIRVMTTGNNRDIFSQQQHNHHDGYGGEELTMVRCGVNAGQTTYVTDRTQI